MLLVVFQYDHIQELNGISGNYCNVNPHFNLCQISLALLLFHWCSNVKLATVISSNAIYYFVKREGCADTCTTHLCDQELGLHILWDLDFLWKLVETVGPQLRERFCSQIRQKCAKEWWNLAQPIYCSLELWTCKPFNCSLDAASQICWRENGLFQRNSKARHPF